MSNDGKENLKKNKPNAALTCMKWSLGWELPYVISVAEKKKKKKKKKKKNHKGARIKFMRTFFIILGKRKAFLTMVVGLRSIRENTDRAEYLKIKIFCIAKHTINKIEREITRRNTNNVYTEELMCAT